MKMPKKYSLDSKSKIVEVENYTVDGENKTSIKKMQIKLDKSVDYFFMNVDNFLFLNNFCNSPWGYTNTD